MNSWCSPSAIGGRTAIRSHAKLDEQIDNACEQVRHNLSNRYDKFTKLLVRLQKTVRLDNLVEWKGLGDHWL
jgi:hypothetical protein